MSLHVGLRSLSGLALLCLATLCPCPAEPSSPIGVMREPEPGGLQRRQISPGGWQPTTVAALMDEALRDTSSLEPGKPAYPVRRPLITPGELRGLLAGTALLLATDRTTLRWFDPDLTDAGPSGDEVGRNVSRLGTGLPIAVAVALPAVVDGRYGRKTSGWAAVALVDAAILTEGLKFLTGRERPPQSHGRVRFHGPSTSFGSFPSGHTSAAFTVATVLGARYPKYRLPLYVLATAVGWARMNAAAHFPSDVFVGAGVGIYSGRYVLRHGGRLWSIRF